MSNQLRVDAAVHMLGELQDCYFIPEQGSGQFSAIQKAADHLGLTLISLIRSDILDNFPTSMSSQNLLSRVLAADVVIILTDQFNKPEDVADLIKSHDNAPTIIFCGEVQIEGYDLLAI